MDPSASLSLIGCHSIFNVLNVATLMEKWKKKRFHRTFATQLHCLFTHFSPQNIHLPKKNKRLQKLYDVNVRAIYGCRQFGVGHENFVVTWICLSLYSQITTKTNIPFKSKESPTIVAEISMSTTASKLCGTTDTVDVGVSVDETWQRKGFIYLSGVITAISIDSGYKLAWDFVNNFLNFYLFIFFTSLFS